MHLPRLLLLILYASYTALAIDLKGRIQWNEHCSGLNALGQAKVVLDNGKRYGGITQDGGFTIYNVSSGAYILSVVSHDYAFNQVRVDVLDADTLPEIRPYTPGTPLSPPAPVMLPYPIILSPVAKLDYFTQQQAFNLIGMFNSPMMLMMLFGGIMVFATPYLMKNMDPEMRKEFEERHAKLSGVQGALQSGDIRAGLSSLMAVADEDATAATSGRQESKSQSGSRQRMGKNKKR
ncbi:hypothetical protein BDY19DRAFT_988500 [Irpex rosettiformis]|uniref:Uncharacterized protein n=1 Tax=Irpex rosettiformis TaxID=378272 RepID=A0ACB8ULI5_9APHY|nr:hypothetical protein BDY19DRAFT_988500 [Irpex rosettiformis]